MNFQSIPPVTLADDILDKAFRKARERAINRKKKKDWEVYKRNYDTIKLDVAKDIIMTTLQKNLRAFPGTSTLPIFYEKLMKLTLDFSLFKKSLGSLKWAARKVSMLHQMYIKKIVTAKSLEEGKRYTEQAYGRISSIVKQISKNLEYLAEARRIMRTYPDVKDMFTVCLYGFPNVGKTTLLREITSSTAQVAAYPFTTKTLNVGYWRVDGKKIQVIDVPGTLSRKDKMNSIELQAELAVKELANAVIFVFDATEFCGYTKKQQMKLLQNLGKKKPVFVYLSKTDVMEKEMLDDVDIDYFSVEEILEKIQNLMTEDEKRRLELEEATRPPTFKETLK